MIRTVLIIGLGVGYLQACSPGTSHTQGKPPGEEKVGRERAKFEPEDGKCILFIGQELEALGGLEAPWNDGYLDHFQRPGGFTMYTNFSQGDSSFGYELKGLDGLESTDDWGDSPSNMSKQLEDPNFANMALAIGLGFVNHEADVANGRYDDQVLRLGNWIKGLGKRPVFLRIGYEFGGEWNHYDKELYKVAFRKIKETYDSLGVENVAYVWQSHGWGQDLEELESWYPGDEYVDWCAYSFFSRFDEAQMIPFARRHGKPVFIAEASATISTPTVKTNGKTKETIFSNPEQAQEAWDKWFIPFFQAIDEHPDVIKAVSYINCNWRSHPMWFENPTFQDIDARIQTSSMISERWKEKVYQAPFIQASDSLYKLLWQGE
ncbi:MAG: glycosyl hydrolase [Bacteroidota bacterium]